MISGMSNRFVSSTNYHHHRHHQQRHLFDQYPRLRHHCRHRHRHRDRYHHCHHNVDQYIARHSREGSGLSHDQKYIELGRVLYDSPTPKRVNAKIAQNAHSAFTPNTSVYGDDSEHCSIKLTISKIMFRRGLCDFCVVSLISVILECEFVDYCVISV